MSVHTHTDALRTDALSNDTDRIAVMISGRGSNMQSLVEATQQGTLKAQIGLVMSDQADAAGIEWAKAQGLHTAVIERRKYASKADFEAAMAQIIAEHQCQWVALAGFMRVLSATFVERFYPQLINIHPSRLPAFKGLDTHQRAIDAQVSEHGASVHLVTAELDGGPVVVQSKVTRNPDDTAQTLAARVLQTEHQIYPLALQWLVSGRVHYQQGQLFIDGTPMTQPQQWSNTT